MLLNPTLPELFGSAHSVNVLVPGTSLPILFGLLSPKYTLPEVGSNATPVSLPEWVGSAHWVNVLVAGLIASTLFGLLSPKYTLPEVGSNATPVSLPTLGSSNIFALANGWLVIAHSVNVLVPGTSLPTLLVLVSIKYTLPAKSVTMLAILGELVVMPHVDNTTAV